MENVRKVCSSGVTFVFGANSTHQKREFDTDHSAPFFFEFFFSSFVVGTMVEGDGQPANKKNKSGRRKTSNRKATRAAIKSVQELLIDGKKKHHEKSNGEARPPTANVSPSKMIGDIDRALKRMNPGMHMHHGIGAHDDVCSDEESDNDREEALDMAAAQRSSGGKKATASPGSAHKRNDNDGDRDGDTVTRCFNLHLLRSSLLRPVRD